MFCEKCGATMPDDSMFCEKCGARVQPENTAGSNTAGNAFAGMGAGTGGQVFSNPYNDSSLQWAQTPPAGNFAAPKPSAGNQFSKIFQMFFKAPTAAMKACAQDDYRVPGLVFLGGKCVLVALLLAIFRETISYYVPGLQWVYILTGPMTFLVTLFVLLIMDAIWIQPFRCKEDRRRCRDRLAVRLRFCDRWSAAGSRVPAERCAHRAVYGDRGNWTAAVRGTEWNFGCRKEG